ncbi:hypothetical protein E2C01_081916 [Portunus trituberculatus]|uniref:Uncharacterized protein n=1 Tax=Portunus trituberculatus TaxID=210409 RepID=A0A5B7J063_PORTR|nr:hypothetical protein [Portunus trituberculatus]
MASSVCYCGAVDVYGAGWPPHLAGGLRGLCLGLAMVRDHVRHGHGVLVLLGGGDARGPHHGGLQEPLIQPEREGAETSEGRHLGLRPSGEERRTQRKDNIGEPASTGAVNKISSRLRG